MIKALSIFAVAIVVGFSIYFSATAANSPDQVNSVSGYHQAKGGPHLLTRFVRANMAAQTIAEISKRPVDDIRKQLEEQRLPAVLAANNVDRTAFAEGMRTRFQSLLGQLSNNGYLTADQKNLIISRMDQFAERRALLKGLVDKALADGTITQEQAQTLLKRPH